jgi:hypothetical protein
MADTPTTTPPAKGKGNVLTRKIGPLPGWVWAAIAVGGFYLWKKHQAASTSSSSATTPATSTAALSSQGAGQGSYGYQGPGAGYGGSGAIPTGATAATSSGTATPTGFNTGQGLVGAGYGASGSAGGVTDNNGASYNQLQSVQALQAAIASGENVYYFPTAGGQAVPVTPQIASQIASGAAGYANTPTYLLNGAQTGSQTS